VYAEAEIPILIDQGLKRSSLLLCIGADWTYLKPLLILPSKTIENELMEQGANGDRCLMVHQENGFVCTELYERWCLEVFFSELGSKREHFQYWGQTILILDGLTCHDPDTTEDLCLGHGCWIELLPPHSSDQIQLCNVGVLGPLKANMTRVHPADDLFKQSKQVLKILSALQMTPLHPTITSAFRQAGLEFHYSDEHDCLTCRVSVTCARRIRGVNATGIDAELLLSDRLNWHRVRLS
jgi:hypothetical protein